MGDMAIDPAGDLEFAIEWYREVIPPSTRHPYGPPEDRRAVDAAVSAIEADGRGFTLPAEISWFWRTWDPFGFDVVPWPRLIDAPGAVDLWNIDVDTGLPRVLLPVAYESHGHLFVELRRSGDGPAPLWYFAFADSTIECRYPSLAALFRACAEVVELAGVAAPERDVDRHATYVDLLDGDQFRAVVDRHFAAASGARRTAVAVHDAGAWPAHWRQAQGIDEGDLAVKGRTHTIAQFLAAAQGGPVEARLHGRWTHLAGVNHLGIGRLDDDSGSVTLAMPSSVVAVGSIDTDVEVDVVAVGPPPELPDLDTGAIMSAVLGGDPDAASQMGAAILGGLDDVAGSLPQVRRMVSLG